MSPRCGQTDALLWRSVCRTRVLCHMVLAKGEAAISSSINTTTRNMPGRLQVQQLTLVFINPGAVQDFLCKLFCKWGRERYKKEGTNYTSTYNIHPYQFSLNFCTSSSSSRQWDDRRMERGGTWAAQKCVPPVIRGDMDKLRGWGWFDCSKFSLIFALFYIKWAQETVLAFKV